MTRLWKPSGGSPSRTTGNRQPLGNSWQCFQDIHVCTCGNLLEWANARNKKFVVCCEEAVEDESSLWKGKEKTEQIHHRDTETRRKYEQAERARLLAPNSAI
jgi:hypothetical protein